MRIASILLFAIGLQAQTPRDFADAPARIRINEIQVLGTHNSYAVPADPRVLALVEPKLAKLMDQMSTNMTPEQLALFHEEHPHGFSFAESLSYSHPDLKTQLDAGLRSLEIDVNPDPQGGLFLNPAGYRMLKEQGVTDLAPHDTTGLDRPGFKVLHIPDIDFRSHCNAFTTCLTQIREWSDAHPAHVPLFILVEAKSQAIPILPDAAKVAPFDAKAFDALDTEILSVFDRKRIITPDDIRGDHKTLNEAVLAKNWPTLDASRGKILFLMITANGTASTEGYLTGHPSLKGRVAFVRANPGEEHAAFLLMDNALVRQKDIEGYVKAGYLVRTRTDIETWEAKMNDMNMAKAALSSGAQIVSTDFFRPGNAYKTSYVVTLPGTGVARCNPQLQLGCR